MIDLTKIPISYISLPDAHERREKLMSSISFLNNRNMSMIPGCIDSSVRRGCTMAHITALKKKQNPPFLILEDDCVAIRQIKTIDPPKDADAVYLGISGWGRTSGASCAGIHIGETVGEFVRVYNMLSSHAILYLTKRYVYDSISTCFDSYGADAYVDTAMADVLQKKYRVYALENPMFYQTSSASITRMPLFNYKILK